MRSIFFLSFFANFRLIIIAFKFFLGCFVELLQVQACAFLTQHLLCFIVVKGLLLHLLRVMQCMLSLILFWTFSETQVPTKPTHCLPPFGTLTV